jgi:ABC-2 type transport system permease protein
LSSQEGPGEMSRALAFVKRGYFTMASYPVAVGLSLISLLASVASFYFLARLVGTEQQSPLLRPYGGNYLAFLVVGVVFQNFISLSLGSFSKSISDEQKMGTLELLLMSKTPLYKILLGSALWAFLWTAISCATMLGVAALVFGVQLDVNIPLALLILVLAVTSSAGIGMVSAGVIMVTKQGEPIGWLLNLLTGLLSGVYYPVQVFPPLLEKVSLLLPTTHALVALRQAVIAGASLAQVRGEIILLVLFSCVAIPLGAATFRHGFDRARREGTLSHY